MNDALRRAGKFLHDAHPEAVFRVVAASVRDGGALAADISGFQTGLEVNIAMETHIWQQGNDALSDAGFELTALSSEGSSRMLHARISAPAMAVGDDQSDVLTRKGGCATVPAYEGSESVALESTVRAWAGSQVNASHGLYVAAQTLAAPLSQAIAAWSFLLTDGSGAEAVAAAAMPVRIAVDALAVHGPEVQHLARVATRVHPQLQAISRLGGGSETARAGYASCRWARKLSARAHALPALSVASLRSAAASLRARIAATESAIRQASASQLLAGYALSLARAQRARPNWSALICKHEDPWKVRSAHSTRKSEFSGRMCGPHS